MNHITLVVNAGRSGSAFLFHLLKKNYGAECHFSHEEIPVQVSKPRLYNRAYQEEQRHLLYSDKKLMGYIVNWQFILKTKNIVECGWTSYHLCPFLYSIFGNQFRYIIMHRDPISFAFSRANMGNYHLNTFYDDTHEVSPFDDFSISPQKKNLWSNMNHFEKCMFWWWVVYLETYEFREKHAEVNCLEIKAMDIFSFERIADILKFLDLDINKFKSRNVGKNEIDQYMKETFPVNDEWLKYIHHQDILQFAEKMGYTFDFEDIKRNSFKYKLPSGAGPKIRNRIKYWGIKSKLSYYLK